MKRIFRATLVIGAVVVTFWQLACTQETNVADFEIVLETTPTGWVATCAHGCAWTRLTYDCGGITPCRTRVDAFGVEGVATPRSEP